MSSWLSAGTLDARGAATTCVLFVSEGFCALAGRKGWLRGRAPFGVKRLGGLGGLGLSAGLGLGLWGVETPGCWAAGFTLHGLQAALRSKASETI